MLKTIAKLESVVEGRVGQLHVDVDCPTNLIKEMLVQFLTYISQLEQNAAAHKESSEQVPVEPVQENTEQSVEAVNAI